ncbi:MAG: hypothetical protein HY300_06230 [Verrucomicrobia bacterium]|nr:hypothetical protein [Verrucomicrobiota bacterium]
MLTEQTHREAKPAKQRLLISEFINCPSLLNMNTELETPTSPTSFLNSRIALACCGVADEPVQRVAHSTLSPTQPKRKPQSSPLGELVRAELTGKPTLQSQQEHWLLLVIAIATTLALVFGLAGMMDFIERFPFFIRFVGASL